VSLKEKLLDIIEFSLAWQNPAIARMIVIMIVFFTIDPLSLLL